MWAMVVKEFRELRRDRRTLALMVVVPLVLLVVFGYAARFDVDEVPTVVVGTGAEQAAEQLPDLFEVTATFPGRDRAAAVDALVRGEAVAAVVATARPELLLDGSELFAAQTAIRALGAAGPGPAEGAGAGPAPKLTVLFNPDLDTSAVMVPALAGLILVFIGTVITSLGVVRERQAGTLEQLAVMPFRPRDVFVGKVAPYFLVSAIDLVVIVGVGVALFDVPFNGSVATLALGALLFLFVTLGQGVLISSVSENQGQSIQLAMMTVLPQVLLSGMIFPVESMAAGVRWIAYALPLTYFVEISRGVTLRGAPIDALWFPLAMLAALGVVVFGLATLRFRRQLAPSGRRRARHAAAGLRRAA
jgi:ABC-2 type transport system permease protein